MLSRSQRTTILELAGQGVGKREIARVLGVSRISVRRVLRARSAEVPELDRGEKAEPYRQRIFGAAARVQGEPGPGP
jgi:DNA invertase Pin-like site-specific DNA recombinase